MSRIISSGTLLYRKNKDDYEVLIVNPKGNTEIPCWSIPKGKLEPGEDPETAAHRETYEEAGIVAPDSLIPLGHTIYKSKKKQVYCFTGEIDYNQTPTPQLEEVSHAEFFPLEKAKELLHRDQKVFIDRLLNLISCVN